MPKKQALKIEIVDWFIDWWTDNGNHKVGMIVLINDELHFIEKELEQE